MGFYLEVAGKKLIQLIVDLFLWSKYIYYQKKKNKEEKLPDRENIFVISIQGVEAFGKLPNLYELSRYLGGTPTPFCWSILAFTNDFIVLYQLQLVLDWDAINASSSQRFI